MAEGISRFVYPHIIEPYSAGVYPADIVQPETIECMAENGVSLDGQHPKGLKAIDHAAMDIVVNMSGTPVVPFMKDFKGLNLIWRVKDPIGRPMKTYRKVRDQLDKLIEGLAKQFERNGGALP